MQQKKPTPTFTPTLDRPISTHQRNQKTPTTLAQQPKKADIALGSGCLPSTLPAAPSPWKENLNDQRASNRRKPDQAAHRAEVHPSSRHSRSGFFRKELQGQV